MKVWKVDSETFRVLELEADEGSLRRLSFSMDPNRASALVKMPRNMRRTRETVWLDEGAAHASAQSRAEDALRGAEVVLGLAARRHADAVVAAKELHERQAAQAAEEGS